MARYRLLSFDGGGIRGYISSSILTALDAKLDGKLMDNVDGLCGTSTGGLIALGLASDMKPCDLVALYRDQADEIFTKNSWFSDLSEGDMQRLEQMAEAELDDMSIGDLRALYRSKYTSAGLKKVLTQHVGTRKLSDATRDVAVNTARLWNTDATPTRWTATTAASFDTSGPYRDVSMVDLACATAAAPVFFPPHEISGLGYFADGGLFANNPILNAITRLKATGRIASVEDVEVISLGTGLAAEGIPDINDPLTWGASKWLWPFATRGRPPVPLMSALSDLTASSISEIATGLLGDTKLVRLQPVLKNPIVLDDHSKAAYADMDAVIATALQSPDFDAAVKMAQSW